MNIKKVTVFFDDGSLCGDMQAELVYHKNGGTISNPDLVQLLKEWEDQQKKKKPSMNQSDEETQASK